MAKKKKISRDQTGIKPKRHKKAKVKHGPFRRFVDNADSIIVAVIFVLVVTQFTASTYNIPSSSMDPTLLGKPGIYGDRLIVDKLYYRWHPVNRWDIAVFKSPIIIVPKDFPDREGHTIFIKRMVGIAGDAIEIRHGDIYITNDELKSEIPYKHAKTGDTLWFEALRGLPNTLGWDISGGTISDTAVVHAEGKSVDLKLKKSIVDTSPETAWIERKYSKPLKNALRGLLNPVGDVMLDVEIVAQKQQGSIDLIIAEEGNEYRLSINFASKKVEMKAAFAQQFRTGLQGKAWDGSAVVDEIDVEVGEKIRVRFSNADDRIIAEIDGDVVFDEYAPVEPAYINDDDFVGRKQSAKNSVSISVYDTSIAFADLAIFRDLYYMDAMFLPTKSGGSEKRYVETARGQARLLLRNPDGKYEDIEGNLVEKFQSNLMIDLNFKNATREPYLLQDDEYFALGDNTANSNDSRAWGPLKHDHLQGRAILRFWPIPPFGPFRPGLVK